jgi:hypothetical protein
MIKKVPVQQATTCSTEKKKRPEGPVAHFLEGALLEKKFFAFWM